MPDMNIILLDIGAHKSCKITTKRFKLTISNILIYICNNNSLYFIIQM